MATRVKTFDPKTYKPKERVQLQQGGRASIPELADEAWLREAFEVHGLTNKDLSEMLGCSKSHISEKTQWLRKKQRGKGRKDPRFSNEAWLRLQYRDLGRLPKEIAADLGLEPQVVVDQLDRLGIIASLNVGAREEPAPKWLKYENRRSIQGHHELICTYVGRHYNVKASSIMGSQILNERGEHARRIAAWLSMKLHGTTVAEVSDVWSVSFSQAEAWIQNAERHVRSCPAYAEEVRKVWTDIERRR